MSSKRRRNKQRVTLFRILTIAAFLFPFYAWLIWSYLNINYDHESDILNRYAAYFPSAWNVSQVAYGSVVCLLLTILTSLGWIFYNNTSKNVWPVIIILFSVLIILQNLFLFL
ncbi:MAG TPA: hypothetical protein VM888_15110 [Chitinophagaceae bacterium]|nr:hypothetical protein [Chitinophagaceae bacterium]